MNHNTFDAWTKALTRVVGTRRGLIQSLTAGVIAAKWSAGWPADLEGKKRKKKKKKKPARCPSGATACAGNSCGEGCACFSSVEGASCCVLQGIGPAECEALPACTSTAGCESGNLCINAACTPQGVARKRCWPLCGGG